MRIAVDARCAADRGRTGTHTYVLNLLAHMVRLSKETGKAGFDFLCYTSEPPCADVVKLCGKEGRAFITLPFPWRRNRLWVDLRLLPRLLRDRPHILFLHHLAPLLLTPFPVVTTVFDLAFLHFPDHFPRRSRFTLKRNTAHAVRRAERVITISEATKRDLLEIYGIPPEKVSVTYPGVDQYHFKPCVDSGTFESVRQRYRLPEHFFLYVGALQPRKNLIRLLTAYTTARSRGIEWPLVVAGPRAWLYEDIVAALDATPGVRYLDYVPFADLPVLYSLAGAFVYIPLYEGFGLPVLEAMACGTPVITSSVSSLPEVAGDAAVLVDPYDTEAIATALQRMAEDEELQRALREKGLARAREFSWERCARETLGVFEEVVKGVRH
ncbi:glycosyltransferase [Desulfofundulus thermobenzoicus]|uniref:Glycosyltransferase n=1 Tax=Desulfofundulus thermobenzoicus TaxID=29376 RepID=A0A6N7IRX4_9FIRM|nr:glycosyltransferase family 1 protein [Desulfofundulus thermobenzoicus]MQL52259.1 glycosyltransferase [Desulfofundulus thermobenzoicus]